MAKLSEQLKQKEAQVRITRTQKVAQRQQFEREKVKFEGLKTQAEQIQKEKFKDKVIQETYTEEVPDWSKIPWRFERKWDSYSGSVKSNLMKTWGREGKTKVVTKTRDKVIPFTLEETGEGDYSYKDVYDTLSPDLKQFFDTPTTVLEKKAIRIETTKQTIQEKHNTADQKIADYKAHYSKKIADREAWFRNKSSKYRHDQDNKDKQNKTLDKYEDDLDEKLAKMQGYKKGLSKGQSELEANKDVDVSSIESYAMDLGNYEEDKEEARNEKRAFEKDQKLERRRLEEAGYKPQVIEKSFKGKPTAVQIGFYNPKTKDWVSGTEYKIKAPVDISGLEKLGYSAPQQRKIEFGGKTYTFKSRVGIYKAPSGEIVTPYQRTGVTEAQVIKQAQDVAFKEWQKKPKPIITPFKIIESKDLPIGYGGQQTISTEPTRILMSEQDYYRDVKSFDFGVGKVWKGAKTGFKFIDEIVHWDFSVTGSPSMPKLSLIKFGKIDEPTIAEKYIGKGVEGLRETSQKIEEWAIGKEKIETYTGDIEKKYQTEYQTKFESKYMEDLIYEKKTFEDAEKEFAKSEEATILQKKYAEEYGAGYKELQTDVAFWRGTAGGLAQTGVGLGSFGLKAISTPSKTALTIGAIYTGTKVLKAIPSIVSTGVSGGLAIYGGIKFLDPTSTYIERGGGLLTLAIAGATLGYGAYRHLRSPVIKTVKIKAPKITLKSSEVIGKDIKIITDQKMINKVIFENQKLSQIASAGRRTIVTTKMRSLLTKYIKFKPAPIYRGVPTQQLGTVKYYEKFGGLIKIGKPSGYQKAFIKLTKYGWTPAQAKATLRYVAPRVTEQYLSRGVLTIKGTEAIGEFEYLTKKSMIDIDKTLGIKTRGGKTIKDIYDVERKLITTDKAGKITRYVLEGKTHVGVSLKAEKLFKFTDVDYSLSVGVSEATKTLKGYEYVGKDISGLDIFKKVKYKDIYSVTATQKVIPMDKIVVDKSTTMLIDEILDLRSKDLGFVKPAIIKKTPFSTTLADDIIGKVKPTPSTDISKVINKLDDISVKVTPPPSMSKYYGKGQYEQTIGGLDIKTSTQLQQQLKLAVAPEQIKAFQLKDMIKIKQFDVLKNLQMGQLLTIKTVTGLKSDLKIKSDLKLVNNLKNLMKENVIMKTKVAQISALRTVPALKSQLKISLDLSTIFPALITTPIIRPLTIPKVKPPIRPPIILPFLKAKISKMIRKGWGKSVYDVAYFPDFTSRALGLRAETITEKQASKKLKKLLTGLEIRRGIKLKW